MLLALSIIFIFIISFSLMMGIYILLVSKKLIKKKRVDKLTRLFLIYSLFITLVYVFQYKFM